MATLLHLDSSADLTGSVSRRLTARFATGWAAHGHATVRRDLFLDQPPHLPSSVLHWAPSLRATDESVDPAHDRYQGALAGELLAADVVLVGALSRLGRRSSRGC
jgi:FMN-dependent NADH-azoreductase